MGGHYFSPDLDTPRMNPEVYHKLLTSILECLRGFEKLRAVKEMIPAPGKDSFGDIDILVCQSTGYGCNSAACDLESIAERISSTFEIRKCAMSRPDSMLHLALPWPRDPRNADSDYYAQVDVNLCFTLEEFEWKLFQSAYADLGNILGTIIRPFGITMNDDGLYFRVHEIEKLNRKRSMIFLSRNPQDAFDVLGLDEQKWHRKFSTKQEMYSFAAECRMFWISSHATDNEDGGAWALDKMKSNDRARLSKRPGYLAWVNQFVPRIAAEGHYSSPRTTRAEMRSLIYNRFPSAKKEYNRKLSEWQDECDVNTLWRSIKSSIPPECDRALALPIMKRALIHGECFPELGQVPIRGHCAQLEMLEFATKHWMKAQDIGSNEARESNVLRTNYP